MLALAAQRRAREHPLEAKTRPWLGLAGLVLVLVARRHHPSGGEVAQDCAQGFAGEESPGRLLDHGGLGRHDRAALVVDVPEAAIATRVGRSLLDQIPELGL